MIIETSNIRRHRVLGEGLLTVKNDTVQDPVIFEDEGEPTVHNYKDGVPSEKNNKISCYNEIQVSNQSQNYEGLPPGTNPEIRLTTQA